MSESSTRGRWRGLAAFLLAVCTAVVSTLYTVRADAAPDDGERRAGTPSKDGASGDREASEEDDGEAARERPLRREQISRYVRAENGLPFRVAFPRYDRLYAGILTPVWETRAGRGLDWFAAEFGLAVSFSLPFPQEEIWWRLRPHFLRTEVRGSLAEGWGFRLTGLEGEFLRHDLSSFILIPTGESSEIRLPAPFDVALEMQLGSLDVGIFGGRWYLTQARVLEIDVMMDFIRDPNYRHRFAIGPSGWYDIRRLDAPWRDGGASEPRWSHEFVPLSGGTILYAWESSTGRIAAEARASCGAALTPARASASDGDPEPERWRAHCRGRASLEWIPLAVVDQPLSLPLEISYGRPTLGETRADSPEFRIELGLRLSLMP
jgi:hypothetical protein